ncbi:hypothetical protein CLV49_1998 [Labedella gwakjiensis]|uniref:DUF1579 domain-containing protein n=1 Tax=Labedella gwakjiensis TaxID=390269 RepID=A0A2P8GWN2_9MICO|nr:hypothetical protein [Labedella gwakjiensis]PSL38376.1 hypothetical protein CLV49_1998 [Labedella gwakjiensis]RUQ87095.1 hypothetical protein ELQ93_09220 [Labedella gwakjiensis]
MTDALETPSAFPSPDQGANARFSAALISPAPSARYAKRVARFGRLVGSWDVSARRLDERTGEWAEDSFAWHVAYILDGRAVQDVSVRETPDGPVTIGTAIRVYDADIGLWRVSYMEPARGEYCNLLATGHRKDGIRQDGTRNDGKAIRWNFSSITDSSYLWESFVSDDDGKTWWLAEHNEGTRTA